MTSSEPREDLLDKGLYAPNKKLPRSHRGHPQTYSGGDVPQENELTIRFNLAGDFTQNEDDCACKRIDWSRRTGYFVKFSTVGHDSGHMLNPFGMYFRRELLNAYDPQAGKPNYVYREVPEEAFRDYLQFLASKNEAFVRQAERKVLDK